MFRVRPLAVFLCLAFVLCALTLPGVSSQQGGLRRVTTTTEEGINLNPSLSGDGRRIAFESTEDVAHAGGSDHFRAIRADLSTDPPTFLQMGGARAVAPAISQDGSRIAFAARDNPLGTNQDGNSEIFLYDGAALRQLTNTSPGNPVDRVRNGNFQPSISDDGRFIAFSSNRDLVTGQNTDSNLEVFLYDAATQGFTQLTSSTGTVGATDAKLSGNGARIAYVRDTGASPSAQRDLVIQDRTGGSAFVVAAGVSGLALTYGRAISDDGTRVVYAAETATPNSTQVFLFDGRSLNLIRPITFLGARATDVPLHPTISGDGSRIAFATRRTVLPEDGGSSVDLYTFDIPTGQFARVTPTVQSTTETQLTPTAEVISSLSDDGSVIAFNFPRLLSGAVAFPELGNNSEIYVTQTTARAPFGNLTVLNAASFGNEPSSTKAVAPNSIAVGLGGALSTTTEQSQRQADGSFPRNVGGTTVTVNGRAAQIFFVSPAQVNFLVPPETEIGTAEVIVTASDGFQTKGTVSVLRAAPGVFTYSGDGRGEGVILDADTLTPGPFDPSNGQRRLIVCTTGVRGATQVVVTIGGRVVTVEAVVEGTRLPGLDEIHLLLPADLRGAGKVELFVRANGRDSNPVDISISGEPRRGAVINEVLADPPDGTPGDANHDGTRDSLQDEFVEIVNATGSDIDLSNFELLARGASGSQDTLRHRFAAGTLLPAGGAIVVFGGGGPTVNSDNPVFGGARVVKASTGSLSLVNAGGVITLREPSGAIASLFTYGGLTGLNADQNQSLTRSPDITGPFTGHLAATANERAYSPGTQVNGQPFLSPSIARIELTPPSASIFVGQRQQFTATAYDASGNPMSGVLFVWQTSNGAVATVDQTGLVMGVAEGTAEIRAFARGVQSAPAQVTVSPVERVLTRIEVTPPAASAPVSGTQQFTARALDQFDNQITGVTFAWSSSDPNVATIDPATGLATAISIGTVTITASAQNVAGTATFTVTAPTVIFNEVLADPPDNAEGDANRDGTRDGSDDEFVELVNSTGTAVNISGWTIKTQAIGSNTQTTRHTFAAGTSLPAGEAIVVFGGGGPTVGSDTSLFGCAQVVKASAASGLSLTNGGLTIILSDSAGRFVAQFTYGGAGGLSGDQNQSLTRSPDVTGSFVEHTDASGAAGRKFSPGTRVDGTPFGSCPPRLASVQISPPSTTVGVGQSTQFTAQAFDQFGNPLTGAAITFASNNTSVATVDSVTVDPATGIATATVTGHAIGSAEITATATNGAQTVTSSPATLTVAFVVNAGQVLISEFRTRGPGGASDEFIEIYNPTTASVTIGGLKIRASNSGGTTSDRVTIPAGTTLGPGCHYLVANTSYTGTVTPNQTYGTGIGDDGGVAITLSDGTTIIDQVGMSSGSAYKEGTPLAPFSSTTTANQSYERKPGGSFGNGVDTNNNASDFVLTNPSNPQNSSSGCLDTSTADLSITKDDAPDPVTVGSNVTYTLTITNNGAAVAQSVTVTDNLPSEVAFVSCNSTGGGICGGTGNNRSVTFSSLASGASATVTFVATVNASPGTTITNTATVASTTPDANGANNSASATTTVQAPLPALTINDVTVAEGDSGTKTVDFTVTLSAASTQTVTVAFATSSASPATATAGTDYQSTSGTLTFNPGETSKPVTVTINGDTLVEPDETFFVNLSGATNAAISDAQGLGTIQNDDTPNLVISQLYGAGGNTGATFQNDFVEIFNRGTTTVNFATTSYSIQYVGATGNFGGTGATAKLDISAGTIGPGQYFLVQLAGGANGTALPAADATGSINMAATAGKVALVRSTAALSAVACPVDATIADFVGYGTTATCFEGSGPVPAPGTTTADFRKAGGCTDTNNNSADFLVLTPNPRNTGSPVNNCSGGVAPNLTVTDATVTEGNAGTVTATFTVSLSTPASGADVTFDIATQNNTAVSGSDYVARSLTNQIIPAGQQTYTFTVTVNGDTAVEPDETFFVNVANVTGATVTDSQGTGTIQNDDLPSLSVNNVTQMEGNAGTSIFSFTVSLSAPAPAVVTFNIATADVSAQDGAPAGEDNDYVGRSLTGQTIAAGQQTYSFDVTVNGDTNIEPDELFTVEVTGLSGANSIDNQGVGTIQNDDSPPDLSINDVTKNEGNAGTTTFTFTVSLSSPARAGGVTFDIATADGTATTAGNDYTASSLTSQTIAEGSQTYTFDVAVTGDTIFEPNETFFVNVANVTGATVSDSQGTGTITNDDAQPTITIADVAVTEGNAGTSLMTFTVTMNGTSQTTASVNYATADSSAMVADTDYDATSGTLNFVPGDTTESFTVTIHGDTNAEGDEMFLVNLSGASGATITDSQALGTIFLDDPFSVVSLNTIYSENFNSLAQSGVSSTTPAAWTRAETGANANNTYTANNGGSNTGDTYSYGTTGSPDRALGTLRATTFVPTIGAFYRNDTGFAINTLQLAYTGEQWRLGSAGRADRLDFQYSTSATSLTTGTWTDVDALDFTTPNTTTTGAKDGNDAANRTTIGSTITGLNIAPGATFWIRWNDVEASGADDGLAVDDFSLTAGINTPALSIDDVSHVEGNGGPTTYSFTVSLSSVAGPGGVTFDIATQDNTATTADNDYVARSLAGQTIPAGQQTYTFDVTVNGDATIEPTETFFVNVANVTGATVSDSQGTGTITNDDAAAASADLSVTKMVNNSTPNIGERVVFTVTLNNAGTDSATGVQVTDLLPAGLTFVSSVPSQGTYSGVTGIWNVGTVSVGSPAATLTITATVATTGAKVNTAQVTASGTPDPDSMPNDGTGDDFASVTVTGASNLVINEVHTQAQTTSPPADANDFVELYNKSAQAIDISGLVISYRGTTSTTTVNTFTLPASTVIPANSYLIIVNGATTYGVAADFNASGGAGFNLTATSGGVKIELNGVKLDGLAYQSSASNAIPATFAAFGEGTPFTSPVASGQQDYVRSPNGADSNDNVTDFRRSGANSTTVTPKAANPTITP